MSQRRIWIGESRPQHRDGGNVQGGSQFFLVQEEGKRERIARVNSAHAMEALHAKVQASWEGQIYRLGEDLQLPFPRLDSVDGGTITTELVGPSVEMLLRRRDLPVPLAEEEVTALVVNTIRANVPLADNGVMPFDGHLGNA